MNLNDSVLGGIKSSLNTLKTIVYTTSREHGFCVPPIAYEHFRKWRRDYEKALPDFDGGTGEMRIAFDDLEAQEEIAARREICELLLLIHSEVSEAAETLRGPLDPKHTYMKLGSEYVTYDDKAPPDPATGELPKTHGFGAELADIVIRCFHLAGLMGLDLGGEIVRKVRVNNARPFKHGKKF